METKAKNQEVRRLGKTGPEVLRLGVGCMGFGGWYGQTDERESIRMLHAAIERGATLLDTGDFYGMGASELVVGKAIADRRDKVVLSVKFGALRAPDNAWLGMDTRPQAVKTFAAYSLKRLGVEAIDIYRPSRLDPAVPIEDTVGAIADLIKSGYVRHVGLSEVGVDTIRRANAVHPVADLQIEYSLASRNAEAHIFPVLRELGIGATLYGVYSRGLLTGRKPQGKGDLRAYLPRFSGQNREKNDDVVEKLRAFAAERQRSVAEMALGWVLARVPDFHPVVGLKTMQQLDEAFAALERPLSAAHVSALDALLPAGAFAGERYGDEQMRHLDSEKKPGAHAS
ncbi:MAG TPA: aldo/keto reductase [Polyangiaceae bacterium]|nr:aldo/keto reductase [Polyangiaceae bacterium]